MARPSSNASPLQSHSSGQPLSVSLTPGPTNSADLDRLAAQMNTQFSEHAVQTFFAPYKKKERQRLQQTYQYSSAEATESWLTLGGKETVLAMLEEMRAMDQTIAELLQEARGAKKRDLQTRRLQIAQEIKRTYEIIANWDFYLLFNAPEIAALLKTYEGGFSLKNRGAWADGGKQRALNIMAELQALRRTLESLMRETSSSKHLQRQHLEVMRAINLFAAMIARGNTDSLFQDDGSIAYTIGLNGSDFRLDIPVGELSEARAEMRSTYNPNQFSRLITSKQVSLDVDRFQIAFYRNPHSKRSDFLCRESSAISPLVLSFNAKGIFEKPKVISNSTLTPQELHNIVRGELPDTHQGLSLYLTEAGLGQNSIARLPKQVLFTMLSKIGDTSSAVGCDEAWNQAKNAAIQAFVELSKNCIIIQQSKTEISLQFEGLENQLEIRIRIKNLQAHDAAQYDLSQFATWTTAKKAAYFTKYIEIEVRKLSINLDLENWLSLFSEQLQKKSGTRDLDAGEMTRSFSRYHAEYACNKADQLLTPHTSANSENSPKVSLDENDVRACAMSLYTHYLSSGNTPAQARVKVATTVEPWFNAVARDAGQQTVLAQDIRKTKAILDTVARENARATGYPDNKDSNYLAKDAEFYLARFDRLSESTQHRLLQALSELHNDDTRQTLVTTALRHSKPGFFKNLWDFISNKNVRWAAWRSLKKWASDASSIYTAPQLLALIKLIPKGPDQEQAIISALSNPTNNQTLRNDPKSCMDLWLYVRFNFSSRSKLYESVCGADNSLFEEILDQSAVTNCIAFNKIRVLRILSSPKLEEDRQMRHADEKLAAACNTLYTQDSHHSLKFFIDLCSSPVEIARLAKVGFPPVLTELYMGQLFHYPHITKLFLQHAPEKLLVQVRNIFSAAKTAKYRTSEAFLSTLLTDSAHTKNWLEQDLNSFKETCSTDIVLRPNVFKNVIAILIENNQIELAKEIAQRQNQTLLPTLLTTEQLQLLQEEASPVASTPPPPAAAQKATIAFVNGILTPVTSDPSSPEITSQEASTSEGSGTSSDSDSEPETGSEHESNDPATPPPLLLSGYYDSASTNKRTQRLLYASRKAHAPLAHDCKTEAQQGDVDVQQPAPLLKT